MKHQTMAFGTSIGRCSAMLCCFVLVVTISLCLGLQNSATRYRHFDDYLRNMDSEERAIITDETSPEGAEGGSDAERSITTTPATTTRRLGIQTLRRPEVAPVIRDDSLLLRGLSSDWAAVKSCTQTPPRRAFSAVTTC
ncbi:hypothetical protein HPB51_019304 [Rhipicephalus microplus]|uniref:Secreted protein n=1 Tax=Rhipicephalus microplus TaxID=6941 RepID=A0A9J6EV14_RHIMP|nr:hypothetical protein HPB51_019304 [Rhipicephalus microplus]